MNLKQLMDALDADPTKSDFVLIYSTEMREYYPGKIDDSGNVRFLCGMEPTQVHEVPLLQLSPEDTETIAFDGNTVSPNEHWDIMNAPESIAREHWKSYADPYPFTKVFWMREARGPYGARIFIHEKVYYQEKSLREELDLSSIWGGSDKELDSWMGYEFSEDCFKECVAMLKEHGFEEVSSGEVL